MRAAPWLCLGSIVVVTATLFVYCKLYVVAVFLASPFGLLSFASLFAYWRTGKEWLANLVSVFFIIISLNTSRAGLLWGLPQSLAFATFFMALPLVLFRKPMLRWLDRKHS
jgi:hypothetical protein